MPFQFVDDTIQSFTREHPELLRALEQYYDEQNITLQKLAKIVDNDVEKKKVSQVYQAFCQQLGQMLVQQQNRVLSLLLTSAMARVVEKKQESVIAQVNPRDGDVPPDVKRLITDRFTQHNQ